MNAETRVKVFVSHHSSKAADAEEIEKALGRRGVDCWIAPRDVPPGEPFDLAVRRAIQESSAVLLLFCAESDKSKHVKRELILADDADKPIIPVRLENLLPSELAYHLAAAQWIDWVERREAVIDRVADKARAFDAERRRDADRATIAARAAAVSGQPPVEPTPPPLPGAPDPEAERKRKRAFAVVGGLAAAILLWNLPIWGGDHDSDPGGWSAGFDSEDATAEDAEADADAPGAIRIGNEIVIDPERRQVRIGPPEIPAPPTPEPPPAPPPVEPPPAEAPAR